MSVQHPVSGRLRQTLYTPAERARRDSTVWTLVQGVLAPLQFLAFALSLCLVVNFLVNGSGLVAATLSVMIKTAILYAIMVTGAIWEKAVFGRTCSPPLFLGGRGNHGGHGAPHRLVMWLAGWGATEQMWMALAAYASTSSTLSSSS